LNSVAHESGKPAISSVAESKWRCPTRHLAAEVFGKQDALELGVASFANADLQVSKWHQERLFSSLSEHYHKEFYQ
jgi:hypothetical protein